MAKKQSAAKKGWRSVSTSGLAPFVDWKKTKTIHGIVKGFRKYTYKKKTRELMEIANPTTGEMHAIGGYAALQNLFREAKKGDEVEITLTGRKKIKGQKNPMLEFRVRIKS